MACTSTWEACPFLHKDREGADGDEGRWERGGDRRRRGRGYWLVGKINENVIQIKKLNVIWEIKERNWGMSMIQIWHYHGMNRKIFLKSLGQGSDYKVKFGVRFPAFSTRYARLTWLSMGDFILSEEWIGGEGKLQKRGGITVLGIWKE